MAIAFRISFFYNRYMCCMYIHIGDTYIYIYTYVYDLYPRVCVCFYIICIICIICIHVYLIVCQPLQEFLQSIYVGLTRNGRTSMQCIPTAGIVGHSSSCTYRVCMCLFGLVYMLFATHNKYSSRFKRFKHVEASLLVGHVWRTPWSWPRHSSCLFVFENHWHKLTCLMVVSSTCHTVLSDNITKK